MELNESQNQIVGLFLGNLQSSDFKGIKVQAGPGTGKTTLLIDLIGRISEKKEIYVMSHMNSAIDIIEQKLKINGINDVKISTIASFLIEYFLVPFSYSIWFNEESTFHSVDEDTRKVKNFLEKITKDFLEVDVGSNERHVLYRLVNIFGTQPKYFDAFKNILEKKGVKYIFIDEYLDTESELISFFKKIVDETEIKFLFVGDKNQAIGYNEVFDIHSDGLLEKTLRHTYRFGENILHYVNSILDSGIQTSGDIVSNVFYYGIRVSDFIKNHKHLFQNKDNIILLHPYEGSPDHQKIVKALRNLCHQEGFKFKYYEKEVSNYHLKKFFGNLINFIAGNHQINYTKDVEVHMQHFLLLSDDNKKELFFNIIGLPSSITISDFIDQLNFFLTNMSFKKDKESFLNICNNLKSLNHIKVTDLIQLDLKAILDFEEEVNPERIVFNTNTIHSAKGKEYDNVIIIDLINNRGSSSSFDDMLLSDGNELYKRFYYVAVSRARSNVFTFDSTQGTI